MREQLIDRLAEPGTGASLQLEGARREGERIVEGVLVSQQTGARFPIRNGIPRFVPEENYASSFGRQWNRFRECQLDGVNGTGRSMARFDAELGWDPRELRGKWVLDAGCGAGRFAEIAAGRGAEVVALDYSSAVDAAAKTLAPFPNADVVQGNMLEPPFKPGAFAYAYSIGVIQHTPDPQEAIRQLIPLLEPGGRFGLTIYGRKPWTKLNGKYLVRPLTRRMPQPLLMAAIEQAMPVLFPVTNVLFRMPLLGKVARFAIPIANYVERTEDTEEQRYAEAVLDTFDMLSPRYDSPMQWTEVAAALSQAGAARWDFRQRIPVNVVGVR
jgi:SAM-dependent methyltransferase